MCLAFLCGMMFSGCVVVQTGVTNPAPELPTVAVAPFFNLSQEPSVDGRRFAFAYYAELQKIPGYQVIPVGVVEQAIDDHHLQMNRPEDVLELAKLLQVDSVVVGAVTDYSPYYPPRVGLQIAWYSPNAPGFRPGLPTTAIEKPSRLKMAGGMLLGAVQSLPKPEIIPIPVPIPIRDSVYDDEEHCDPEEQDIPPFESIVDPPAVERIETEGPTLVPPAGTETQIRPQSPEVNGTADETPPLPSPMPITRPHKPTMPYMSYTRLYDGSDAELVAVLRDYLELNSDLRAGGWQSYLYRTEDFLRFTSHRMIVEMLTLHGGHSRNRVVFKWRKHRTDF